MIYLQDRTLPRKSGDSKKQDQQGTYQGSKPAKKGRKIVSISLIQISKDLNEMIIKRGTLGM